MEQQAQALASMLKLMMMGMGALNKAFYQKYGKDALPIITEVMGQGGVEWGKIMQQMAPDKNIKVIGEMLKTMGSTMGMGVELIESPNDTLHFKMAQCPMGIEGTSRELCEAMMTNDKKMTETLLGQEVETKIIKSVAAGDKECEVIFSKK